MAPPVNTSFATATAIGSLPYTFTQSDINDAGVNFTVYYKFTAPAGAKLIGAWGFSGNIGAGYQPIVKPYLGPAGSPTQILAIAGTNIPIQFPVNAGSEYFLEFTKNVNTAGPEHLDVNVQALSESGIPNGAICVIDDTVGFPAIFLSPTADNTVVASQPGAPSSEQGDITRNGVMAIQDNSTANIDTVILSRTFGNIATIAGDAAHNRRIRTQRAVNKFYMGFDRNPPLVQVVSENGTIGGTTFSLGTTSLESLCADNTEAILYYCQVGFGVPVKRWDLALNSAMSDLVGSIASYQQPDILVIGDGTIIVLYYNSGTKDVQAKRYNAAGSTLNTYSLGAQSTSTKPRMAYALDDPNSFWVFTHNFTSGSGRTIGRNVKVSDGSILTTRSWQQYEGGNYDGSQTASPVSRFGNSFSCPFFVMAGSTISGIYFINPNVRHDIYYDSSRKIPDPTIRTAIVGE